MPSPLEAFTILLGALGLAAFTRTAGPWRSLYLPLAFATLAAVTLATEAWAQGLYWPMFPADFVVLVCAVLLPFRRAALPRRTALATLILGSTLCLGSLVAVYALPFFKLPAPSGPYSVGTRTEHLTDPATHRELVVQLWYPALPAGPRARYMLLAETRPRFAYWHAIRTNSRQDAPLVPLDAAQHTGPLPLLLFSHMWGGRRTQDTFLAEDLASHGYLVAAVDHPGNSARISLTNGTVLTGDRAQALSNLDTTTALGVRALWTSELELWTADNENVLDTLLNRTPAFLAGHIDNTRVGAFGHSFGGAASIALLGVDTRVQAALNMDGWTLDALDHRTTQPIFFLYAGHPLAGPPTGPSVDDQLERQDLASVNQNLARYGGCEAYLADTQHADFTDQTLVSPIARLTYTGPLNPARVRPIVRGLVLGFFDQALKQQGPIPSYPEVKTLCKP